MISSPSTGRSRAWPLFAGTDWVTSGLVAVVVYSVCLTVGQAWLVDVREVTLTGLVGAFLNRCRVLCGVLR